MPNEISELSCRDCGLIKPLSSFSRQKGAKHGVRRDCKACSSIKAMRWRDGNRDRILDAHLRRAFDITLDHYKELMIKQGGLCAICHRPGPEIAEQRERADHIISRLVVDHDHATGRIRGLLCGPCNRAIGLLQDDPEVIRSAAFYVSEG